jgi:hypothetical protein
MGTRIHDENIHNLLVTLHENGPEGKEHIIALLLSAMSSRFMEGKAVDMACQNRLLRRKIFMGREPPTDDTGRNT